MTPTTYPYKSSFTLLLFLSIIFGIAALFLFSLATTPDVTISFKNAILLPHLLSVIVLWLLVIGTLVIALGGLFLFINQRSTTKEITLGKYDITCPSLMSSKPSVISYSKIVDLKVQKMPSQHRSVKDSILLLIFTSDKKYTISSAGLPKENDLMEIYNFISTKLEANPRFKR